MFKILRKQKGFTLIELMVVTSVISALAMIVLVGVTAALDRAKNSRIETDFYYIKMEAAKMYATSQSYSELCDDSSLNEGNSALYTLVQDIKKYNRGQAPSCYTTGAKYCVSAPLFTGQDYCVDYTGYSGRTPSICDGSGGNPVCH